MKIFVAGPEIPDSFSHNIAYTLRQMGHEVASIPIKNDKNAKGIFVRGAQEFLNKASLYWRMRNDREALNIVKIFKPNLTIVGTLTLEPETVLSIKKISGSPVICWFADTSSNIKRNHIVSNEYDVVFLKDRPYAKRIRSMFNIESHYLDEACNPDWHKPATETRKNHLLFSGSSYGYRNSVIKKLHMTGYDIQLFGNLPPTWANDEVKGIYAGQYLDHKTKSVSFGESLCCINTFAPAEGHDNLNCRIFETCASGAILLSERRASISRCFDVNEEYLDFDNFDECCEKIEFIKSNLKRIEEIRKNAVKKAHSEHSYKKRLNDMFNVIGL